MNLIPTITTLSDLIVWVKEMKPDVIIIPKNHPLKQIREFNPNKPFTWKTFRGIPIEHIEK